ncbi:MAG: hypothetical protein GY780_02650 [bacterium]|nr:hypothetical protein [bacterium]
MKLKNLLMLLATLALLAAATGCIFSPDDDGGDGGPSGPTYPPNTEPDVMMANFKDIYEAMDSDAFEDLLHADFRSVLSQETIDAWNESNSPLELAYFDRDAEIQIHRNIFEGLGGIDEDGIAQPPVDSIAVNVLDKDSAWEPVDASEEYFGGMGAYKARFNMLMYFNNPNGHRFEVQQPVDFYAIQGSDDLWKMVGQRPF